LSTQAPNDGAEYLATKPIVVVIVIVDTTDTVAGTTALVACLHTKIVMDDKQL